MEKENYSLLAALALGALGGLVLGHLLWGGESRKRALSEHLSLLSKLAAQIEEIDPEESDALKDRINTILQTIESTYGKPEGSTQ